MTVIDAHQMAVIISIEEGMMPYSVHQIGFMQDWVSFIFYEWAHWGIADCVADRIGRVFRVVAGIG